MSMAVTGWACSAICGHTPSTASMRLEPAESAKARASPGLGGAQLRAVDNGDARAGSQRIGERARQRQAGGAAAGNDDVVALARNSSLANRSRHGVRPGGS